MIIIDSDDYRASGVETLFFPGGEPHAKLPIFHEPVLFHLKARTWNDVGHGACVWDTLMQQYHRSDFHEQYHPTLFMPYFPGARQDKTDGSAPITKDILVGMFSHQRSIHVFDLHSTKGNSLWQYRNWMPSDLKLPPRPDVDFVIAPDNGAAPRAVNFMKAYCPNAQLICATKVRNQATGKLSNYSLPKPPKFGKFLVVDDICDGGATFLLLAQALNDHYESSCKPPLELFVSHGIFSKGPDSLLRVYDRIYTTDSFWNWQYIKTAYRCSRMTIYPLRPLAERIANHGY